MATIPEPDPEVVTACCEALAEVTRQGILAAAREFNAQRIEQAACSGSPNMPVATVVISGHDAFKLAQAICDTISTERLRIGGKALPGVSTETPVKLPHS